MLKDGLHDLILGFRFVVLQVRLRLVHALHHLVPLVRRVLSLEPYKVQLSVVPVETLWKEHGDRSYGLELGVPGHKEEGGGRNINVRQSLGSHSFLRFFACSPPRTRMDWGSDVGCPHSLCVVLHDSVGVLHELPLLGRRNVVGVREVDVLPVEEHFQVGGAAAL